MTHDLIRRLERLGNPRIVVVGDLILDRYIWGYRRTDQPGSAGSACCGPTTASTGSAARPASRRCCGRSGPRCG